MQANKLALILTMALDSLPATNSQDLPVIPFSPVTPLLVDVPKVVSRKYCVSCKLRMSSKTVDKHLIYHNFYGNDCDLER